MIKVSYHIVMTCCSAACAHRVNPSVARTFQRSLRTADVPRCLKNAAESASWLADNAESETELLVGFMKVGAGKPSLTRPESGG